MGIGCDQNLDQSIYWARQVLQKNPNNPISKHYLGSALFIQSGQSGQPLSSEAINLLIEADNEHAYFMLGLIYEGVAGVTANFELAENYYRMAINFGLKIAKDNLLLLYYNQLSNSHQDDANYPMLLNACHELISNDTGELSVKEHKEILKFIEKLNLTKHHSSINLNKELYKISNNSSLPTELRLEKLLDTLDLVKANSINLAMTILQTGRLLAQSAGGIATFKKISKRINNILMICNKSLKENAFSQRSILNMITGISNFYQYSFNTIFDELLVKLYSTAIQYINCFSLLDFATLLSAASKVPLSHHKITNNLQDIINGIEQHLEDYIDKKLDISSLAYSIALLDNYQKTKQSLQLAIPVKLITTIFPYTLNQTDNIHLAISQRHQYFLATLYFANYYSKLFEIPLQYDLWSAATDLQEATKDVIISNFQDDITTFIKQYFPMAEMEKVINTLPVDIFIKPNFVVQIDGPKHFVMINEKLDYERSPKDFFHDTLLNCSLSTILY